MSSPQLPHFVRVKGEAQHVGELDTKWHQTILRSEDFALVNTSDPEDELEVNLKACGLNNSSLWMSIHELQEWLGERLRRRLIRCHLHQFTVLQSFSTACKWHVHDPRCLEQLPKRCQMKIDLSNNPDINDEGLECASTNRPMALIHLQLYIWASEVWLTSLMSTALGCQGPCDEIQ